MYNVPISDLDVLCASETHKNVCAPDTECCVHTRCWMVCWHQTLVIMCLPHAGYFRFSRRWILCLHLTLNVCEHHTRFFLGFIQFFDIVMVTGFSFVQVLVCSSIYRILQLCLSRLSPFSTSLMVLRWGIVPRRVRYRLLSWSLAGGC